MNPHSEGLSKTIASAGRRRVRVGPDLTSWLVLSILCLLLFFAGLGDRDLTSSHEARAAQNAQMILDEGCWLLPRLYDRHLELQKPPLYYWLVAVGAWLRGGVVDAWAVRLPAALAGVAAVLWLFFLVRRRGGTRAGFLAAVILASFVHFTATARVGRIDMPLTLCVSLVLGGIYLGAQEKRRRWLFLAYTALAAGLLLKGPIAAALPGAVILAWIGLGRRWASFPFRSLLWGVPWTLALALPWYVAANAHSDNQIWEIFLRYHNVERGFGSERLAAHPVWFYFVRLWVDLLPWSVLLPLALKSALSRQAGLEADGQHRSSLGGFAVVGFLWFAAMLLLLSLLRFKRADYLVPAYPGLAWFLALWLERVLRQASWKKGRIVRCAVAAGMMLVGFGWTYQLVVLDREETNPRQLGQELRQRTDGMVIFFRTEDHALAFHVGRPLDTILEWENLAFWASQPTPIYVVMPPDCAAACRDYLPSGRLEVVEHWRDGLRRPLVLLRNRPANS